MSDLIMSRSASALPIARHASVRTLSQSLRIALRTYLTRQSLPALTQRALADIGVSASAAMAEAARLPWDTTPGSRRRKPGMLQTIGRALERARTRRLISRLEPRELRDIGVSPSDAQAEAHKRFWQI